jgi:hypothetical protein
MTALLLFVFKLNPLTEIAPSRVDLPSTAPHPVFYNIRASLFSFFVCLTYSTSSPLPVNNNVQKHAPDLTTPLLLCAQDMLFAGRAFTIVVAIGSGLCFSKTIDCDCDSESDKKPIRQTCRFTSVQSTACVQRLLKSM